MLLCGVLTFYHNCGQVGGAGAGMGSRGPGETKIELDRRRIHTRMAILRKKIKEMKPARVAKRANRVRNTVPSVAIAGYTNAGKSSLLNRLTRAGVLVENALFATLDATVRKSSTDDGRPFTYSDTVGFVRNLPHQLVEAFRSTLEEVQDSDIIVHVVDGSHPDPAAQLATVREVISEVDGRDIPEVVVFNKSDLIDESQRLVLQGMVPDAIFVSARTGAGIDELRARIAELLPRPEVELDLLVPFDRGDVVSRIHEIGRVVDVEYVAEGTRVTARVYPQEPPRVLLSAHYRRTLVPVAPNPPRRLGSWAVFVLPRATRATAAQPRPCRGSARDRRRSARSSSCGGAARCDRRADGRP